MSASSGATSRRAEGCERAWDAPGVLEQVGRLDDAITDDQELLRLNPNDNQGARYLLVALLLEAGREDEAGRLFEAYPDDVAATFLVRRGSGRSADMAMVPKRTPRWRRR